MLSASLEMTCMQTVITLCYGHTMLWSANDDNTQFLETIFAKHFDLSMEVFGGCGVST